MRNTWKWTLALSLSLLATAVQGQSPPTKWVAAGPGSKLGSSSANANIELGRPMLGKPVVGTPATPQKAPVQSGAVPSATLAKPIAHSAGAPTPTTAKTSPGLFPIHDRAIQPASFQQGPIRRARGRTTPFSEVAGVRSSVAQPSTGQFTWASAQVEQAPLPRVVSPNLKPATVATTPLPESYVSQPAGTPIGTSHPYDECEVPGPVCCDECGVDCEYGSCCDDGPFGGCGCNDGCCYLPHQRFFVGAEYLLWWTSGSSVPPLVTTGDPNDLIPGALGQPGTRVLYGNDTLGDGTRSGGRLYAGYWFTRDHTFGIDGSIFFLNEANDSFFAESVGDPVLARPFFNVTPGANTQFEDSQIKALPGVAAGNVSVDHSTRLWGGDANFRTLWACGPNCSTDLILGYRGMSLEDDLNIRELVINQAGPGSIRISDMFQSSNRFHGGQIGFLTEWRRGRWTFGLKAKVALGNTRQRVMIAGATTIGGTGTAADGTYDTGILAVASNSGTYSRNRFTVIPEVGLDIGYQVTDHLRAFVGYDMLYWSSVVRAGEHIDRMVDTRQFAPPTAVGTRPAFAFNGTSYWAQGLRFGLEFRY